MKCIGILLIGFALLASTAATAQTTITMSGYTALLNTDGILTSRKVGGAELIGKPLAFCPGVKWTTARVEKPGPNEIRIGLKSDRGVGEIAYRFDEKRITTTLSHKLGGFQSWQMNFSEEALGVENLQNPAVSGAEIIQYVERGDIRPTPVSGLRRTQRMRLHLRNGANVLFWHDGWGAPFNVDELGSFQGYGYRRNLLENNKPMQVVFELEAPPGRTLLPAPAYTPFGDTFSNLTYFGQPVGFHLKFTPETLDRLKTAKNWRIAWVVRDFFNQPVTAGSSAFDTASALTAKAASVSFSVQKRGWFSVIFTLAPADASHAPVLPSEYRTRFAVVDKSPSFPDLPPLETRLSDYGYAALIGLKCIRESHVMRDYFPERGKTDWKRLDEVMDNANREAKRWGVNWFFQANEVPNWCTPQDYEQLAFEMVSHCKDRCRRWEVENEPNFRFSPDDYMKKAFVPFATGTKRADPGAQILGPACVSVPNTLRFMEALHAAGADRLLDGVSTHTYVGPGEPWELFGNPQYLAHLRTLSGNKPLWQTEQGYSWGNVSRQEQARYVLRQYLNADAAGIPNERQYYFYPVHNGFEPWYLVESGGNDGLSGTWEPSAVALHTLFAQTAGRNAGILEQPLLGVQMLRYAGTDADIVALWTLDFPLTLTLRGKIESAANCMGNPLLLKCQGAETLVPADGYALYLRVPHGGALKVVSPAPGQNVSSALSGVTARASSETKDHPASLAFDGQWAMRDAVPGLQTRTYWEAGALGASPDKPQWLQVDFPQERTLNRSLLLTPLPAVDGGVPRDFIIQVSRDSQTWQTVANVKDWVGWTNLITFKPIKTRHARLLITRLNDGWHLDGKWMFMVSPTFTRYTSMQARVLDWMLFGP